MSKPLPAFGFLTALEDRDHGFFGGYLVISAWGRPQEFHCSAPVLPNQAQRILYGTTLRSYVLSDLIGQALLAKSQLPVHAVLSDCPEMLELAVTGTHRMLLVEENESRDSTDHAEFDAPQFNLGNYRLRGTTTCVWNESELTTAIGALASHVELGEPFERIREAIREAQRVTDQPPNESHDIAAA